ncbi:MAG: ribonuclease P protein component [Ginsengibacter sp.]
MIQQRFTLRPFEKLKSRKLIDGVFKKGKSFTDFPFRVIYLFTEENKSQLQAGFAVSSKIFKRAVDRNRIKRLMREAYRLQKNSLQKLLEEKQKNLVVFIVFTGKELPLFTETKDKIKSLITRLEQMILAERQ